jgi:hypothetical protein
VQRLVIGLLSFLLVAGCASMSPGCPPIGDPPPPAADLDSVLFVIGDAGGPVAQTTPVLARLRKEIARAVAAVGEERTITVFAGDNVYERGFPPKGAKSRKEAEQRLAAQIAIAEERARVRFVAGNHDWKKGKRGGLAAIREQNDFIAANATAQRDVALAPKGGCPGPEALDVGERLRLLFVDTQFWLHHAEDVEQNSCVPQTKTAAFTALSALVDTPRQVVIVAHHPLRSGGPHGGYFDVRQHLFPLTEVHPALYVPLPLVGSLYPLARRLGISSQDLRSRRYRELAQAMRERTQGRNVLWAAGHEHNLQLFAPDATSPAVLVSGIGMTRHASPLRKLRGMEQCSTSPGFARIDMPRDGAPRVVLIEVREGGQP